MDIAVGIDALNIDGGTLSLDLAELAIARDIDAKFATQIGFKRRSVIAPWEDPVTLAVNAAKPIVDAVGADAFGLLIVATESSFDCGMPMSSYIQQALGIGQNTRNFEIKHACYSGTAALQMAAGWLKTAAKGRRALVICTDLSRPAFLTTKSGDMSFVTRSGELIGGVGAVAMSLSQDPALFTLDDHSGYASKEVYDVTRPIAVDYEAGNVSLSLHAYLDLLEGAWMHYQKQHQHPVKSIPEHFDSLLFHTPLTDLCKHAFNELLDLSDPDLPPAKKADLYTQMCLPALHYNYELANIYSGSLYASLAGLARDAKGKQHNIRVGLFSYGSGACGEFFSGSLSQDAASIIAKQGIDQHLSNRLQVTPKEYENFALTYIDILKKSDHRTDLQAAIEKINTGDRRYVLSEIKQYHRHYEWLTGERAK